MYLVTANKLLTAVSTGAVQPSRPTFAFPSPVPLSTTQNESGSSSRLSFFSAVFCSVHPCDNFTFSRPLAHPPFRPSSVFAAAISAAARAEKGYSERHISPRSTQRGTSHKRKEPGARLSGEIASACVQRAKGRCWETPAATRAGVRNGVAYYTTSRMFFLVRRHRCESNGILR